MFRDAAAKLCTDLRPLSPSGGKYAPVACCAAPNYAAVSPLDEWKITAAGVSQHTCCSGGFISAQEIVHAERVPPIVRADCPSCPEGQEEEGKGEKREGGVPTCITWADVSE